MVDLCKIILWNYGFMYGLNWDFTKEKMGTASNHFSAAIPWDMGQNASNWNGARYMAVYTANCFFGFNFKLAYQRNYSNGNRRTGFVKNGGFTFTHGKLQ